MGLLFLLFSLPASAQDKAVHLQEVEVVSQRKIKDSGLEKSRLDSTVLHENVAMSLADVLSRNSTLFIKSYGRATEATAEFRGTSPSHTQVLWNGMKINSPMFGTVDFSTIPAFFVDEANLYHGASSLTLTGGGLGGAVEMLTVRDKEKGFHAKTVQGYGSFNTYDGFLKLGYVGKKWTLSTRAVYSTSDNDFTYTNYDKKTDEYADDGSYIGSYHPKEKNKSGYFTDFHLLQEAYYDATAKDRLSIVAWYSYTHRGLPFLSVDYKEDSQFKNECKQKTLRSVMAWNHHEERWSVNTRLGYSHQDVGYHYSTNRTGVETDITHSQSYTNTAFLQSSMDYEFSSRLLLTAGLSAYHTWVESEDMSPFHIGDNYHRNRSDGDATLQLRWRPVDRLTLSFVGRGEWHGAEIANPVPALFTDYVLYEPLGLVVKASVTRNYRYPSMDDMYFQPGGNPDLQPEQGFTYDGGVEMSVVRKSWNMKANLTVFDSYISDWILWTPNAKGFWQPSNVKKVHNYGVEAELQWSHTLGRDWCLDLSSTFAWTPSKNMGEDVNSNDASYGKQLCYVPEYSSNINGKVRWRSWSLGYQWTYYSERFTTTSNDVAYITGRLLPYYNSDINVEKTFSVKKIGCSLKLQVNNLLGSEYATVLSRPLPGRSFEAFLMVKI